MIYLEIDASANRYILLIILFHRAAEFSHGQQIVGRIIEAYTSYEREAPLTVLLPLVDHPDPVVRIDVRRIG